MAIGKVAPKAAPATKAGGFGSRAGNANAAAPPANAASFMSLNPEDMTQGGGLIDDVDVLFKECRFVEWDYDGKAEQPALCLVVTMEHDGEKGKEETVQYYSAGSLSKFVPSEDGKRAVPVSGGTGMNMNTNAAMLLKSVIEQGFPVDKFGTGDVSAMDGLYGHINRIPQPDRGGRIATKNASGYDKTVAVVTKIHRMPWDKAGKSVTSIKGAGVAKAALPQAEVGENTEEVDLDLDTATAELLINILAAKNGTVLKSGLAGASFKLLTGNPNRAAILQRLTDDEFLAAGADYGWEFNGKTITAAE